MSTISDDEIIRRRLIIEGESGNDDRRIGLLLKNYLRWLGSEDTGSEGFETLQALISSVWQCQNAMDQSLAVVEMNQLEQENLTTEYTEMEREIEYNKTNIENMKEELKNAKIVRKNRKEYDSLAKIITQHNERQETLSKYQSLSTKLEKLRKISSQLDDRIDLRKKQCHLFLSSLHDLHKSIEADNQAVSSTSPTHETSDRSTDTP